MAAFLFYVLQGWVLTEQRLVQTGTLIGLTTSAFVTGFMWLTCFFVPETLVFRVPHFSKASRYLHEFDAMLENHHLPVCGTRKLNAIGIVSVLILVST